MEVEAAWRRAAGRRVGAGQPVYSGVWFVSQKCLSFFCFLSFIWALLSDFFGGQDL
jgi:hypothetical protein